MDRQELVEAGSMGRSADHVSVPEVFRRDRAALGVVAALSMTTNLSALWVGAARLGGDASPATTLFVCASAVGAMLGLGCIWISVYQFRKINMLVAAEDVREFVKGLGFLGEPVHWLTLSLAMIPTSALSGVYMLCGRTTFFWAAPCVAIVFLFAAWKAEQGRLSGNRILARAAARRAENGCTQDSNGE